MPPARLLDLRILGADAVPLAGARVELRPADGGETLQATTDRRGHATVRLRAGVAYTAVITQAGHRPVTRAVRRGVSPVTMTVALPALDDGA